MGQWCELADTAVEAAIASVARQRSGDEYCEHRHYAVEDIDGDSLDDLVVTFNVEPASGSGDDESYLMVFLTSRDGRAPLALRIDNIGDDYGDRYPTDVSVDGQTVVVDFSNYLQGDPDCCPSGTSTARFLVGRDRIVEVTPHRSPPPSGARSS
ncbi:MAG TPA: LppP/LprE family lipoprotein [Gemmatimonadales bacterium]|nr:LppP/LprE family lipoprotein [Gemmatimonadales bacterium]